MPAQKGKNQCEDKIDLVGQILKGKIGNVYYDRGFGFISAEDLGENIDVYFGYFTVWPVCSKLGRDQEVAFRLSFQPDGNPCASMVTPISSEDDFNLVLMNAERGNGPLRALGDWIKLALNKNETWKSEWDKVVEGRSDGKRDPIKHKKEQVIKFVEDMLEKHDVRSEPWAHGFDELFAKACTATDTDELMDDAIAEHCVVAGADAELTKKVKLLDRDSYFSLLGYGPCHSQAELEKAYDKVLKQQFTLPAVIRRAKMDEDKLGALVQKFFDENPSLRDGVKAELLKQENEIQQAVVTRGQFEGVTDINSALGNRIRLAVADAEHTAKIGGRIPKAKAEWTKFGGKGKGKGKGGDNWGNGGGNNNNMDWEQMGMMMNMMGTMMNMQAQQNQGGYGAQRNNGGNNNPMAAMMNMMGGMGGNMGGGRFPY